MGFWGGEGLAVANLKRSRAEPPVNLNMAAKSDQTSLSPMFQVGFPPQMLIKDGGETVPCLDINFRPLEKELGDGSLGIYLANRM